ncbi:MAG: HypC/HybG/HupF family hydrogenase formation chaperone [Actinobacteria bacterium]|nr:MAG: HypC/HybG/HupF family hydrogenase formation chaperone [Actinomycetota bacterium]
MCLAIPAKIVTNEELNMATVDIMGVTRTVSLDLVPEAKIGDWVLVHAGFALQIVDEETANETLELLKTLPFYGDEEPLLAEGA